ncbi:hypothetical protein C8R43DRAFT_1142724 [Mycena crocata]|nr:hypothetical protein C8R43DRAFT_1142724 [Mycena crocata]
MSPPPDMEPRLPVELEREIFELAAWAHLRRIPSLLLVSQRVKIWTEPILYGTFIVAHGGDTEWIFPWMSPTEFQQLLHSRPAMFFHDHVHHLLCVNTIDAELELILRKCSGAQDVCFVNCGYTDAALLPMLTAMALRRLDTPLKLLFYPAVIDLSHSLFARLTHLCLHTSYVYRVDWLSGAGLATLPCLTHLAFALSGPDCQEIIADALTQCVQLSVFHINHVTESISPASARDNRVVQILVEDFIEEWQAEVMAKDGYWGRAEAIVRQRQSTVRNDLAVNQSFKF